MPLADALRYQIQVQRKLQEQLEVRVRQVLHLCQQVSHLCHELMHSKTSFHNIRSAYVCN
jgi:hypothetical protein